MRLDLAFAVLACLLFGCPNNEAPDEDTGIKPSDGGSNADAGTEDATAFDDATTMDGAAPDAMPGGDGGVRMCTTVPEVRGAFYGRMAAMRTFSPTSPTPDTTAVITENGDFVASAISSYAPTGLEWHAQMSNLTMFDSFDETEMAYDSDGSLYVAVSMQVSGSTATRFYNGDGTLAREFSLDGPSGSDIIGASRQTNFFIIKYSPAGAIQWVHRFGPNSGGDRAGFLASVGLVEDRVRVVASLEGSSQIAFSPGAPEEYVYAADQATMWWAEFDKSTGAYVPASARFALALGPQSSTGSFANGTYAQSPSGETAIAGVLFDSTSQDETFTIGANDQPGSGIDVTIPFSSAVFTKIAADGAPVFVARATPANDTGLEPRAVAIATDGTLIAGGQSGTFATTSISFVGSSGASTDVSFDRDNSFITAISSTGEVLWVTRIQSPSRNAVSELMVFGDGVYLMGTFAEGDVFSNGANSLTVGDTGYGLVRFSLATGQAEWVRSFLGSGISTYTVSVSGDRVLVPTWLLQMGTIAGGPEDIMFGDTQLLAGMLFETDGTFVDCLALARGVLSFQSF